MNMQARRAAEEALAERVSPQPRYGVPMASPVGRPLPIGGASALRTRLQAPEALTSSAFVQWSGPIATLTSSRGRQGAPTTPPCGGVWAGHLTPRCSGLATLAAELVSLGSGSTGGHVLGNGAPRPAHVSVGLHCWEHRLSRRTNDRVFYFFFAIALQRPRRVREPITGHQSTGSCPFLSPHSQREGLRFNRRVEGQRLACGNSIVWAPKHIEAVIGL